MFFFISLVPTAVPGKLQLFSKYELAFTHWDSFFHLFSQQNLLSRHYFQDQLENGKCRDKGPYFWRAKNFFLKMLNDFSKKKNKVTYILL